MRPEPILTTSLLLSVLTLAGPARAEVAPKAADGPLTVRPDDLPRLRVVLRGVLYRSGSPSDTAMTQLCLGGWQRVYSLYGDRTTMRGPRNAAMVEHGIDERRCDTPAGERRLPWQPALAAARPKTLPLIFKDVVAAVRDPAQGPVLVHCWNGLHSAGMIAAMALRQFCGVSGEDAASYWLATTSHASAYPYMVDHIREFRPLQGYSLTAEERRRVCPDLNHPNEWRTALTTLPVHKAPRLTTAAATPAPAKAPPPPAAQARVSPGGAAARMATGTASSAAAASLSR